MIYEITTIFIDIHWFFDKLDLGQTKWQKLNDVTALALYLIIRIAYGYFTTFEFACDIWQWYQAGNFITHFIVIASLIQLISLLLNSYWFVKVLQAVIGKPVNKIYHEKKDK